MEILRRDASRIALQLRSERQGLVKAAGGFRHAPEQTAAIRDIEMLMASAPTLISDGRFSPSQTMLSV
jgi:hypothetical protein